MAFLDAISPAWLSRTSLLVLVAIILAIATLAYLATERTYRDLRAFHHTTEQTQAINGMIQTLLSMRSSALKYRATSDPVQAETVDLAAATLLEPPGPAALFSGNAEALASLEQATADISAYRNSFQALVETKAQLDANFDLLIRTTADARAILAAMRHEAVENGDPQRATLASQILESLIQSTSFAQGFVITSDPDEYQSASLYLVTARSIFDALVENPRLDRNPNQISDLAADLDMLDGTLAALRTDVNGFDFIAMEELDVIGVRVQGHLDDFLITVDDQQVVMQAEGSATAQFTLIATIAIGSIAALLGVLIALSVGASIGQRLRQLASDTSALANGYIEREISGTQYQHEIGKMAKSLSVFKEAEVDRRAIAARAEQDNAARAEVINMLSEGLAALANGNLDVSLEADMAADFETLRTNFNNSARQLSSGIGGVIDRTSRIDEGSAALATLAHSLSARTENQAAALEETSTTILQVADAVQQTAIGATKADDFVRDVQARTTDGLRVVETTVAAIREVELSSREVTKIIGVIDDIAFQTNLLALNAGVEAARAGEAGQGFAVVAAEVRALALRSGDAAKQIGELVVLSEQKVQEGVALTAGTNDALHEIAQMVEGISDFVSTISTSTREQSSSLKEITAAIKQLDELTQTNAAVAEETTASSQELANVATELEGLMAAFTVAQGRPETARARPLDLAS